MSELSVGVLVLSCDKYVDVWPAFFSLFFRYWPDCAFPVYLLSNHETFTHPNVNPIMVGEDESWSISVRKALQSFPHDIALIILEDFFLYKTVNTNLIEQCVAHMSNHNVGYVRLQRNSPKMLPYDAMPELEQFANGINYRCALQIALWRKDVLNGLLVDSESPWDFEWYGSRRSDKLDSLFLGVGKGFEPIDRQHALARGKWKPNIVQFCHQENISINTKNRKIEGRLEGWWRKSPIHVRLAMWKKKLLGHYDTPPRSVAQ